LQKRNEFMKNTKAIVVTMLFGLLLAFTLPFVPGCSSTAQKTAYTTLFGLETGATQAYSAYTAMVIKGTCGTNDVPAVSKGFNTFQAAILPALDAVQYSTNALAPANLIQESTDLLNLITTAESKK
jgi:hypothetical protein